MSFKMFCCKQKRNSVGDAGESDSRTDSFKGGRQSSTSEADLVGRGSLLVQEGQVSEQRAA